MRVNPLLVDPMLEKIELREKLENLQKENEELKQKTKHQEQQILNIEQKLDNITNKMEDIINKTSSSLTTTIIDQRYLFVINGDKQYDKTVYAYLTLSNYIQGDTIIYSANFPDYYVESNKLTNSISLVFVILPKWSLAPFYCCL